MSALVERHRRACDGFSRVVDLPRDSMYGAEIAAGSDADAATRLIAFSGRDHSWRPPSRGRSQPQ